jgi:hypothetical protein
MGLLAATATTMAEETYNDYTFSAGLGAVTTTYRYDRQRKTKNRRGWRSYGNNKP